MKVGDLVVLKDYCRAAGRMAIVIDVPYPDHRSEAVKINYIDTGVTTSALASNLEIVIKSKAS